MKNITTFGRLMFAALLAFSCVVGPVRDAGALTSARVVTANLSSATSGAAMVLRNGESLTYQVLSGLDNGSLNVNTTALQKSCNGIDYGDFSVPISTVNNSHAGTFSGTIPVENCAGGKVWVRFAIPTFTSGLSSTTITEVDNVVRSFNNNAGQSVEDVLDGGMQDNGYRKVAGLLTAQAGLSVSAGATSPYQRTLVQLQSLVPAAVGEIYFCSTCVCQIVASTGTSAGNFACATASQFK